MLNYEKKGSDVLTFIHIVLKEVFFLFLGVVVKKMRKSKVLMQRKDMGMIFKKQKRSDKVFGRKRARFKSPRKYTSGYALRHNLAENIQISVLFSKAAHEQPCRSA